jgi:hypothetical protein
MKSVLGYLQIPWNSRGLDCRHPKSASKPWRNGTTAMKVDLRFIDLNVHPSALLAQD